MRFCFFSSAVDKSLLLYDFFFCMLSTVQLFIIIAIHFQLNSIKYHLQLSYHLFIPQSANKQCVYIFHCDDIMTDFIWSVVCFKGEEIGRGM